MSFMPTPRPAGPFCLRLVLHDGEPLGLREACSPTSPLRVVAGPAEGRERILARLPRPGCVVYILTGRGHDGAPLAYVGSTTAPPERLTAHARDPARRRLTQIHVLASTSTLFSAVHAAALERALVLTIEGLGAARVLRGPLPPHHPVDPGERFTLEALLHDARRLLVGALCPALMPLPGEHPDPGEPFLRSGYTLAIPAGIVDMPGARVFALREGGEIIARAVVSGRWRVLLAGSRLRATDAPGVQPCISRKRKVLIRARVLAPDPARPGWLVARRPFAVPSLTNLARIVGGDNRPGRRWEAL